MTYEEFTNLSGMTEITEETYHAEIEPLYYIDLRTGKAPFCKDIAKIWDNEFFQTFRESWTLKNAVLPIYKREQQEDAELMLKVGTETKNDTLIKRAEERLGKSKCSPSRYAKDGNSLTKTVTPSSNS